MSMDIRPPLITGQTLGEQVQQLIAYLTRLARQLQTLPENQPAEVKVAEEIARPGSVQKLRVHKELTVEGGINGVSIRQVKVWGSTEFLLKTRFSHWNGDGNVRQSLLVAGCMNSNPLLGVVRVSSNGSCQWEGTQGVTVSTRGEGVLCVKLPVTLYEHLLVMSPNEFNHIV
ncbi:MAG: hypothetical protein IKU07_09160 [Oscillospiraceae bacterium]|nr:hypothetical protein [Oscillospiraceae bacterium]